MKRAAISRLILTALLVLAGARAFAEPTVLQSHWIEGRRYVMLGDLARYYHWGHALRISAEQREYRTGSTTLLAEAGRREIEFDGVRHWLSAPVPAARGELWLTPLDVLKTIDPVIRHGAAGGLRSVPTVVLDPGHGGRDEGTHGLRSREKDLTLDVALRVAHDLAATPGVRVLLTRTHDLTAPLEQRVEFAAAAHADLYVSIHFNSGGTADGIETYCVPPAGAPPTARAPYEGEREAAAEEGAVTNNRFDEPNVWLAHCVQKALVAATHANDRGVRRARFYVLRYAACPAILIEAGFLSNHAEETKILTPGYRETLAEAIAGGIREYTAAAATERRP